MQNYTIEVFEQEKKRDKIIKYIVFGIIAVICMWIFIIKRPLYIHLFSTSTNEKQVISNEEVFQDLPSDYAQTVTIAGYKIKLKLLKYYKVTAKVGYVDRYKNPLGRWYRDAGYDGANILYDKVVPQDLTLAWGDLAQDRRFNLLNFEHEHRTAFISSNNPINSNHWGNFHTIAATPKIQFGIDALKYGDIVTVEGYLLHWESVVNGRLIDFTSAIYPGEISKQRAGGQITGLCKQLYLTKLIVNGRLFE